MNESIAQASALPVRMGRHHAGTFGRSAGGPLIAILCPKIWGVRNFGHSGLVGHVEDLGMRTCTLLPARTLVDTPEGLGMTAELLSARAIRSQRGFPAMRSLLRASFARRYGIASYRIFNRWSRRDDGPVLVARNAVLELLSLVGSRKPFYDWQIRLLERRTRRTFDINPVRRQLEALRPALVVSTNCQFSEEEPYVLAARDLGIPTLGCIQSFDNLSSRSVLPVFDSYVVWSERMKTELLRYYPDRDPARVYVTGTPQFDFHLHPDYRWDRALTLRRLGLAPGDRYVVYAAMGFPNEPDLLRTLGQACGRTPKLRDLRIVVRPHPATDPTPWQQVARETRFVLSWPWLAPEGVPWDEAGVSQSVDQARLVSTLLHADACVTGASTISLDAAVVGTPVICVAFAGGPDGREERMCREAYQLEHYRPIAESGGVRVVTAMQDLVSELIAYRRDRARDEASRRALVDSVCGPVDGRVTGRVADVISRVAREVSWPRCRD